MIIATYRHGNYTFGLATEDLSFTRDYLDNYHAVFSLTGYRSSCSTYLPCSDCPFYYGPSDTVACEEGPITKRDPRYLSLFGITRESHPEFFI